MTATTQTRRDEALRRLEAEVGVMLRRVRRVIAERAQLVHDGLQPSGYLVLTHVADHGPLRGADLCAELDLDKGAVSRRVQHLIDLGLIERHADPDDRRATRLSVTDDGAQRLVSVGRHRREMLDQRLSGWADADIDDLVGLLSRYNATLDAARTD